jgi:cAMP-binding proteins - catabolite gene activator and regulatory subunit of cAMP-dependent protein kinases
METVDPLVRKLSHRSPISDVEREVLRNSVARTKVVDADVDLVAEGSKPTESTLLVSGFAARYSHVADGRRQILAIHVAGDFIDLHSFLLKRMDHGIYAMSTCTVAAVPHERLAEITEGFPHLTRQLWLSTLIDAAILRQWLVGMGRKSAAARAAHLICELNVRLSVVGLTRENAFDFPVTQEEFADSLGMSLVHLSRSIQDLRSMGLFDWQRNRIEIMDWSRLQQLAEFDPTYLNLADGER